MVKYLVMKDAMKLSASIRVKDTSIKDKRILLATKNINLPSTLANKSIYLGDSILKGELEKFSLTGLIENSTNELGLNSFTSSKSV